MTDADIGGHYVSCAGYVVRLSGPDGCMEMTYRTEEEAQAAVKYWRSVGVPSSIGRILGGATDIMTFSVGDGEL